MHLWRSVVLRSFSQRPLALAQGMLSVGRKDGFAPRLFDVDQTRSLSIRRN